MRLTVFSIIKGGSTRKVALLTQTNEEVRDAIESTHLSSFGFDMNHTVGQAVKLGIIGYSVDYVAPIFKCINNTNQMMEGS